MVVGVQVEEQVESGSGRSSGYEPVGKLARLAVDDWTPTAHLIVLQLQHFMPGREKGRKGSRNVGELV